MFLRLCPSVRFASKKTDPSTPFLPARVGSCEGGPGEGGRGPLDSGPVLADCQTSKASKTTERYTNTPDEETKGSILKGAEPVSEWVCGFVWHYVCECLCVFACVRVWASSVQDSALIAQGSCRQTSFSLPHPPSFCWPPSLAPAPCSAFLPAFLFLSGILRENAANTIKLFMSVFGQPNVLIITSWRNFLYCAC